MDLRRIHRKKNFWKFYFMEQKASLHFTSQMNSENLKCTKKFIKKKRSPLWIVNKVNINTRCSVSISRKVLKSVFVSVSTNVFQTPAPDILNVTKAPPYQNLSSTKNISKCALSVSDAAFIPAPILTVNLVMPLHGHNILVFVNTTCHVNNMSPYIPFCKWQNTACLLCFS